ncbi:hypothetical protein VFPBJ_03262 [Purpureocillium lilacinum]|uniref:Uncharacterized protein n=1 Tax=Purpureocillium lilacinum TaxID=33203 RepID=A0A179H2V9_PURLI|nr:hypothetical protein VFPBJ_03262 [Purpureocillium lilacinum]
MPWVKPSLRTRLLPRRGWTLPDAVSSARCQSSDTRRWLGNASGGPCNGFDELGPGVQGERRSVGICSIVRTGFGSLSRPESLEKGGWEEFRDGRSRADVWARSNVSV